MSLKPDPESYVPFRPAFLMPFIIYVTSAILLRDTKILRNQKG